MTVFRAATLRTFFFAIHAGAKELTSVSKWQTHNLSFYLLETLNAWNCYDLER